MRGAGKGGGGGGCCPESPGAAAPAHAPGARAAAGPGRAGSGAGFLLPDGARWGWSRRAQPSRVSRLAAPAATARRWPGARRHDGQVRPGRGERSPAGEARRARPAGGRGPVPRPGPSGLSLPSPPLWQAVEGREQLRVALGRPMVRPVGSGRGRGRSPPVRFRRSRARSGRGRPAAAPLPAAPAAPRDGGVGNSTSWKSRARGCSRCALPLHGDTAKGGGKTGNGVWKEQLWIRAASAQQPGPLQPGGTALAPTALLPLCPAPPPRTSGPF